MPSDQQSSAPSLSSGRRPGPHLLSRLLRLRVGRSMRAILDSLTSGAGFPVPERQFGSKGWHPWGAVCDFGEEFGRGWRFLEGTGGGLPSQRASVFDVAHHCRRLGLLGVRSRAAGTRERAGDASRSV